MPKTTTAGTVVLTTLNTGAIGTGFPGGLEAPNYQSRQQIGNFLFVTDGVNKSLHAINSNSFERLKSVKLPDPTGLAINPDGDLLYVTNEGSNSLSVVNADPSDAAGFMSEIVRVDVGDGPRAVAVSPDNEDVFVLNRLGNSISIVDVGTNTVRRTLTQSGINRPNDVAIGVREVAGGPAFQSGTYHAFIANGGGNNVLIFEGGPSGLGGIGFDNIIGAIAPNEPVVLGQPTLRGMRNPTAIVYDPNTPLDGFAHTIGAFVAHSDSVEGNAMVSRISYSADSTPGQSSTTGTAGFGDKVFTFIQQYVSESTGKPLDVALPDYNRSLYLENNFATFPNLLNAGGATYTFGAKVIPRNSRYPLSVLAIAQIPRWDPDRLYLSVGGGTIDVFNITTSVRQKTITTIADATVMASYFGN
jgi:YVTN family beta-propeller protein